MPVRCGSFILFLCVLQARQERKAAYEVTSNDVTKWQPMVKVSGGAFGVCHTNN